MKVIDVTAMSVAISEGQTARLRRRAARFPRRLLGKPGAQDAAEEDDAEGRHRRGARTLLQPASDQGRTGGPDGEALAAGDRSVRELDRTPGSRARDTAGRCALAGLHTSFAVKHNHAVNNARSTCQLPFRWAEVVRCGSTRRSDQQPRVAPVRGATRSSRQKARDHVAGFFQPEVRCPPPGAS
jgi:hypothetical protein